MTRPEAAFPVLEPEEEASLLRRIMGTAIGGLQYAGQSLDKPGSAIRGLLAGKPEALLNLIPFSDSIGITNPSERVYSRDLLENAGVLGANKPGLDWGDALGFVGDVALDPLSFINPLGALSKGGHVARSAGIIDQLPGLAKESALAGTGSLTKRGMRSENTLGGLIDYAKRNALDDAARTQIDEAVTGAAGKMGYDLPGLLDQRLGGGIGFSSGPFGRSVAIGGEARPVGAYGAGLDKIGSYLAYGKYSPLRPMSAGFSRAVQGNTNPIIQQELRSMDPLKQAIEPQEILRGNQLRDDLKDSYAKAGIDPNDLKTTEAVRAYREGQLQHFPDLQPYLTPEAKKVADDIGKHKDSIRFAQEEIGWKNPEDRLNSKYGVEHDPRYIEGGEKLDLPRKDILDVPGGSVQINRLLKDGRLVPQKVLTTSEKSRASELMQSKFGMTQDDINRVNELAKDVREGRVSKRQLLPGERAALKTRAQAYREARGQKAPFQGETARHKIIFRDVFGMTDEQFVAAKNLAESIENGTRLGGNLRGPKVLDPRKIRDLPTDNPAVIATRNSQRDMLNKYEHAKDLSNWLRSKGWDKQGRDLFPHHSIQDNRIYSVAQRGQLEYAKAAQDVLARSAKSFADIQGQREAFVNLNIALKELGFKDITKGVEYFAKRTGGKFGKTAEHVDAYVPKQMVDDLAQTFKQGTYKTPFNSEKQVNAGLDFFDRWVTNFFKAGVTLSPAFHARNKITGTVQNVISGAYKFSQAAKYEGAAHAFSAGETVKGLSKFDGIQRLFGNNITDKVATKKLREIVDAYDLRGSRFDEIIENVNDRNIVPETAWEKLNPDLLARPGAGPISWKTPLSTIGEGFRRPGVVNKVRAFVDPTKAAGIKKNVVPAGVPLKAGEVVETSASALAQRQTGRLVEDMNRVGAMLAYLDKGMDIKSAIQRTKLTHVDYRNLSSFEKSVMRRVIPFYSFSRGIVENTAKEIMEHPGGKLAQTIRGSNSNREGGGYVPDYIGEGAAIPLGPDKYLHRLGLMHEAAFDPFVFRSMPGGEEGEPASMDVFRTPARTIQKFLSMMNPAFKTPVEWGLDTNLYTGRKHKDLYPYPISPAIARGDFALAGNLMLGASPASRAIRTVRKVTDDRKSAAEKALATLLGLSITDVYKGAEEAKELDAKRVANELLEQSPRIREYSTFYSPESVRGNMTPTERSLLRLQATQNNRARERAKEVAKSQ